MFTIGNNIRMTLFGASHDAKIGVVVDGLKAGYTVNMKGITELLARRKPNTSTASTKRQEADAPAVITGLLDGKTTGAPVVFAIDNGDAHSADYNGDLPRPGHSDYPAYVKYEGHNDVRGGGFFSGRMTACLCIGGAIAMDILAKSGIKVEAIGRICGDVEEAAQSGDSVGGIVSCTVTGVPAGYGDPLFGSVESKISSAIFSVPAVKGVEFGLGFKTASLRGSQNNDEYYINTDAKTKKDFPVLSKTNNAGGVLGGITTGMPITFNVAIKPTPSIAVMQRTVSLSKKKDAEIKIEGRHDVCIVPRAVPVIEAVTAFTILDIMGGHK